MNELTKTLFGIVNAGIHGTTVDKILSNEIDWDYLYRELSAGKLEAVCYNAVKSMSDKMDFDIEFLKRWQQRASYLGVKQLGAYVQLAYILQEAKQEKIEIILFKGAALAQLYPEYLLRYSCDVDLLVSEADREKMDELLRKRGYIKNEEHSKECVPVYVLPGSLIIELHTRLWEDYTGKRVQILERMDLTQKEKLITMYACNMEFITLGYTEHLVYQMYHIIKHFSFQGMDLRHFTDTALYVNHFFEQIDFLDFWEKMKQLDYAAFCYCLFKICIKYFGMNEKALTDNVSNNKINEEKLLEEMFAAGMVGLKNYETMVAASIVYQTYYAEDSGEPSRLKILRASLFPPAKDLSNKYSYAKKNHLLLPFAWCHRAGKHLIARVSKKEAGVSDHLQMANQKFKILKELELINKQ